MDGIAISISHVTTKCLCVLQTTVKSKRQLQAAHKINDCGNATKVCH